jgi:hypothetical protein
VDVSGQTASGLAAKRNHEEVVQLLNSSPPKP